jgi:hypothetical protein
MKKKKNKKQKIGIRGIVNKYWMLIVIAIVAIVISGVSIYNTQIEASATVDSVVTTATAQAGKPYVWGASGTSSFDCSGLVYYTYQSKYKIKLANQRATANDYYRSGKSVAYNDLRKGDLVFFEKYSDGTVHHIGIYTGDKKFVHASGSYGKVLTSSFSDNVGGDKKKATYGEIYAGARRVMKPKGPIATYEPIKKGSKPASVKGLQRDLNTMGYPVPVTGKYDTKTAQAVKRFQTANNLKEKNKGFFGPESWECMNSRLKVKFNTRYGA